MELPDVKNSVLANVVKKLQHLDCTLLGSGEESWLYELLFTPGVQRFQLLEWFLAEMNFSVPKVSQSPDECTKNLLCKFAGLGLCRSTDNDLILGKSSKSLQLQFWKKIIDILWEKKKICGKLPKSNEEDETAYRNECKAATEQQYNDCCRKINLVANSVNMNKLFREKIDLLPIDVERNIEFTLMNGEISIDDLKAKLGNRLSDQEETSAEWIKDACTALEQPSDVFHDTCDLETENNTSEAAKKVCSLTKDFDQFFNTNLKPVLKPPASSTTVNESFKTLHSTQKSMVEVLNNLSIAKSCYSKLNEGSESLESCSEFSADNKTLGFSRSALEGYAETLQTSAAEMSNACDKTNYHNK